MELLLKLNRYPSENTRVGKLVNNWGSAKADGRWEK
jgi:hypothetical protein